MVVTNKAVTTLEVRLSKILWLETILNNNLVVKLVLPLKVAGDTYP